MAAVHVGSGGSPLMVRHLLSATRSVAGVRLSDSFEDGVGALLDGPVAHGADRGPPAGGGTPTAAAVGGRRRAPGWSPDHQRSDHGGHRERPGGSAGRPAGHRPRAPRRGRRSRSSCPASGCSSMRPGRAAGRVSRPAPRGTGRPPVGRGRHSTRTAAPPLVAGVTDPGETTLFHRPARTGAVGAVCDGVLTRPSDPDDDTTDLLLGAARAAAAAGAFRRAAALPASGHRGRATAARHGERRDARRVAIGSAP